jgi:phenylalanyl-tRNA synthetase beta chain
LKSAKILVRVGRGESGSGFEFPAGKNMPTITAHLSDLGKLIGEPVDIEELERALPLVKGEIKSHDEFTGEVRIDLADGNRPDLWSPEGVARQVRVMRAGRAKSYSVFSRRKRSGLPRIVVESGLEEIRPYIAGFTVTGLEVTEDGLQGMIEAQEKLSEVYGRRRKAIAIGVYDAAGIAWPVHYRAVEPTGRRFIPLGMEEALDLAEILEKHPKGVQYAPILEGLSRFPFLEDDKGAVLSFPPVINSSDAGLVNVGDSHLFVEVTGTTLESVLLTINIFAVNLADRGATIRPCEVIYPYETAFGREVTTPKDFAGEMEVPFSEFERILGTPVDRDALREVLGRYGVRIRTRGQSAFVSPPPYRDDYLHPWDAVEDYAISRGYDAFSPEHMTSFTAGGLDSLTLMSDRAREIMVGLGYEEIFSNVLTSPANVREKMDLSREGLVEIENVYSETYSAVRDSIVPSLLEVEAESVKAAYPHLLFEEGDVAVRSSGRVRTEKRLAAIVANASATFSEIHSHLSVLLFYLDVDGRIEPADHAGYIEGRCGDILIEGEIVGRIGEVHPGGLDAWSIKNPVAAFELSLSPLSDTDALS